jgi:small subunit ribosomal protein S16
LAVKIRLARFGKKKNPCYRIVVIDSRAAREAEVIENVGYYHPMSKEKTLFVNEERVLEWLKKGAKPTDTVSNLLRRKGILKKFHEI